MNRAIKIFIAHNLVRLRKLPRYSVDAARDTFYRLLCYLQGESGGGAGERDDYLIVFISQLPRAREGKLSVELRKLGYRVVQIYRKEPNYDLRACFNQICKISGPWEALYRARQHSPLVYHVFTLSLDKICQVILAHKPGKVVFDTADVFAGLIRGFPVEERLQRICLERADGLCCKDLQVKAFERKCHAQLTRHKIWLPDLCTNPPKPLDLRNDDEMHVVNAGVLLDEVSTKDGVFPIIDALAQAKIHVHLYPSFIWFEGGRQDWKPRYQAYFDLANRTGFVHVHAPVPLAKLLDELRQYDFGLALRPIGGVVHEMVHYKSCGSSRLSDYLEAGLGVIVSPDLDHQRFIARRYGTAIDANRLFDSDFRDQLVRARREGRRASCRKFDFIVAAQVPRLVNFYQRVANIGQAAFVRNGFSRRIDDDTRMEESIHAGGR